MPSPILHVAAGAGICLLDRRSLTAVKWRFAAAVMLASVLPDFDVVPGLLIGDPNRFHSDYSHSIGAALIAALLCALLVKTQRWRLGFWVVVSWTTHVLLDALTVDGRPPYGVPLFWPFSRLYFQLGAVFPGFRHGYDQSTIAEFLSEVFSRANLQTMLAETALGLAWILACAVIDRSIAQYGSRWRKVVRTS